MGEGTSNCCRQCSDAGLMTALPTCGGNGRACISPECLCSAIGTHGLMCLGNSDPWRLVISTGWMMVNGCRPWFAKGTTVRPVLSSALSGVTWIGRDDVEVAVLFSSKTCCQNWRSRSFLESLKPEGEPAGSGRAEGTDTFLSVPATGPLRPRLCWEAAVVEAWPAAASSGAWWFLCMACSLRHSPLSSCALTPAAPRTGR